jgi:hypothetical protein
MTSSDDSPPPLLEVSQELKPTFDHMWSFFDLLADYHLSSKSGELTSADDITESNENSDGNENEALDINGLEMHIAEKCSFLLTALEEERKVID